MKRLAPLLVLLALVPAAHAKGPTPVYALEWRLGGGVTLRLHDAATLAPLAGFRLDLGAATNPLALSPDRRRLAVAGDQFVRFADLRSGRLSPKLYIAERALPSRTLWVRPNTVIIAGADELIVVDPRVPKVVSRVDTNLDLLGSVRWLGSANIPARLVLLLGPPGTIGPLSIGVVDTLGRLRTVPIELRGGTRTIKNADGNFAGVHQETPGLALDPTGTRAIVAGPSSVAVVKLGALEATTHALQLRTTQKMLEGWSRSAAWLDATHVAVYGSEYASDRSTPVPVQIIDVNSWTAHALDVKASYAVRFGSTLVAVGDRLTALDPSGSVLFTALDNRSSGLVVAGHGYVYAETTGHGTDYVVLDPGDGRVVARKRFKRPTEILGAF